MQEDQPISKSRTLTVAGSKSSDMKINSLSMSTTRRLLMLQETRMLKDKTFKSGTETTEQTRDGELYTLTLHKTWLRDSIKTSVSISIDHSTSNQDSQCTEWLWHHQTELWRSHHWKERVWPHNNSTSMERQRLLCQTNGRINQWTLKEMEDPAESIPESPMPDGGNYSDTKTDSSSTRKESYWMSTEAVIQKTEMLSHGTSMVESTNNGISSTPMTWNQSQPRDKWVKTSDCM